MKVLKNLVLPISFLRRFLDVLGIIASNMKRFPVCLFIIYMSIWMKKNQNRTYIFLLKITFSEQSKDLIGE